MKNKASVLTLRIPSDLKHKIERIADEQGISINQLALYAFTKEIQELETSSFFSEQYSGKSKREIFDNFHTIMKKVRPRRSIPGWDKL